MLKLEPDKQRGNRMLDTKHFAFGLFATALLGLVGCDRGPVESQPTREQAEVSSPDATDLGRAGAAGSGADTRAARDDDGPDPRDGPQPTRDDGRPLWAANRSSSAEEAAQRQFERNGETFGADTVEEYVDQAHAFVAKPPAGVQRATRSSNGDQLLYDARSNTFAVATRDGAPRTMFKPDDGAEYWVRQKAQAAGGRSSARSRGDDDRG